MLNRHAVDGRAVQQANVVSRCPNQGHQRGVSVVPTRARHKVVKQATKELVVPTCSEPRPSVKVWCSTWGARADENLLEPAEGACRRLLHETAEVDCGVYVHGGWSGAGDWQEQQLLYRFVVLVLQATFAGAFVAAARTTVNFDCETCAAASEQGAAVMSALLPSTAAVAAAPVHQATRRVRVAAGRRHLVCRAFSSRAGNAHCSAVAVECVGVSIRNGAPQHEPADVDKDEGSVQQRHQLLRKLVLPATVAGIFVAAVAGAAANARTGAAVTLQSEARAASSYEATASHTVVPAAILPGTAGITASSVPKISPGSRAAAGCRHVWRGACPSRAVGAFCSAVAVHAVGAGVSSEGVSQNEPDDGGNSEVAVKVKTPLELLQDEIAQEKAKVDAMDISHPAYAITMENLVQLRKKENILLEKAKGFAPGLEALAVAKDPMHTAFFQALCAATEELLAGEVETGPALLKLAGDVIFPKLRSSKIKGRGDPPALLVRQCWKEFRDLILQQGSTLVIGTPGIGKSVFAWWFVRCLAAMGFTVVYRAEKAAKSLLCKDGCVLAGTHGAFDYLQEDTNTWWVYDAMEPDDSLVSKSSQILVVSSPNRDRYKAFENAPGVVKMIMPRWSQEEIKLALQYVYPATKYPGMTTARVDNLFMYYNGVPRFVLGKPSEISGSTADRLDLRDFNNAVSTCEAAQVLRGAVVYESVAEKYHRLLHLIPTSPDYRLCKTEYASGQAFLRVWERAGEQGAAALQAFWKSSSSDSTQTGMRGQILEEVTKMDLASRCTTYDERRLLKWFGADKRSYTAQQRQQVEATLQCITIEPGRRVQFVFDNTNYAQQLQDSWRQPGAWSGRTLLTPVGNTYPEVDCVMLPAPKADGTVELVELYQITAGDDKEIDRKRLANILCALPDAKQYILYFVVPKEEFHAFTVDSISRGKVSKQGQARLDCLEARVIANVDGVNALHSYMSSSRDVEIEDGEEDVISGSEEEGDDGLDSADSATTVLHSDG